MLTVYSLENSEQWDTLVCTFADHDVYWLSGYVKAFQIHGDGEPLLFFYENDGIRGINVVMKRDIAKDIHFVGKLSENEYFDFTTPYGYGGWLIEGKGKEELFQEYENWCCRNGIICEFVRFHPVLKNQESSTDAYEVVPLGNTVALDLSTPEAIWANITSKNRNVIRKAQKNGIKIYNGRYPDIYKVFREIYNGTMDKDNAEDYYYFDESFYESILYDLPQHSQVFYADLGGKVIAASIMLMANGRMNYHLSGSVRDYANLAPTNLILYEAALWGCANGCKTLHLGGGVGSGEDGLFAFKKAFNRGQPCRYHIGKNIFLSEIYEKLIAMRTSLQERGFFPCYRA